MFTQEEITIIKELVKEKQERDRVDTLIKVSMEMDSKVDQALSLIAKKYQPLLDEAEQNNDLETRKSLIEEMALEAKAKEEEIRNI